MLNLESDGFVDLPFQTETELERAISADPEWQKGAVWGKPRPGHSEGQVRYHIADVMANVERQASTAEERRLLRLLALIHDTFKYRVDAGKPTRGANHHATIARQFAERYIDDPVLLDILELHDEAYNSWRLGMRTGDWKRAEARADRLLTRLGSAWPLYLRFYRADNRTDSKGQAPLHWFEDWLRSQGLDLPPDPAETDNQC